MKRIILCGIFCLIPAAAFSFNAEQDSCKNGVCHLNLANTDNETQEAVPCAVGQDIIELTDANFEEVITNSGKTVIVDFYATWCKPCQQMKPIFEECAREERDWIFASIDIDNNANTMKRCGVRSIPSFVIFRNGVQWDMVEGGQAKEQLLSQFRRIVTSKSPAMPSESDKLMELLIAISQRNVDEIKRTITSGADVHAELVTPQGTFCALTVAIMTGTKEIIDLLMQAGASLDNKVEELIKQHINNNVNILEMIKKNFEYIVARLASLPQQLRKNVVKNEEAAERLLAAINNVEELRILIDQGVDVNTVLGQNRGETTPLCIAMLLNNKEVVDLLIDNGASLDVEITTLNGVTMPLKEGIEQDIENYNKNVDNSRELFAYALSKVTE